MIIFLLLHGLKNKNIFFTQIHLQNTITPHVLKIYIRLVKENKKLYNKISLKKVIF